MVQIMRRFGGLQQRGAQTLYRIQNQHFDARIPRDGKMIRALHHDVGNNLRMDGIFRSQVLRGHEHQDVPGVKNCAGLHISRHGVIGKADAVDLDGQFDRNVPVTQITGHREHGPAPGAVTDENNTGCSSQFFRSQRTGMRWKVLQDPTEARIPVNGNEGLRTDIGIFRAAQEVADLNDS